MQSSRYFQIILISAIAECQGLPLGDIQNILSSMGRGIGLEKSDESPVYHYKWIENNLQE